MKKTIYLAGGWFSPQQEEEHSRIYNLLKDNYKVFNPRLESNQTDINSTASSILMKNINGMIKADIAVVITDYKDMGTIWEAGYLYAIAKPIIYYAETLGDKPFNLMLAKTGFVSKSEEELLKLLNDEKSYEILDVYEQYKGALE